MPGIEGDGCVPGGVDNLLTGIVEIPDDKLQVVFVGKL
jgi:hypothetical protein